MYERETTHVVAKEWASSTSIGFEPSIVYFIAADVGNQLKLKSRWIDVVEAAAREKVVPLDSFGNEKASRAADAHVSLAYILRRGIRKRVRTRVREKKRQVRAN